MWCVVCPRCLCAYMWLCVCTGGLRVVGGVYVCVCVCVYVYRCVDVCAQGVCARACA